MSDRARLVLAAIDQAEAARRHHPTLFAAQLRNDRTCLQLQRAVAVYKRSKPVVGGRIERDEVEGPDPEWLELNARRREERFEKRKLSFDADRRQQRSDMTGLELHRHALERQAKISAVAAGNVAPSRGGGDGVGPPKQQLLDDDPRWLETWAVIRARLERAHELLDEAEGLSTVASVTTMLSEQKDKLICDRANRGLRAQAVVDRLGSDIAGSVETVRRVRRRMGFDHLGYERQDS